MSANYTLTWIDPAIFKDEWYRDFLPRDNIILVRNDRKASCSLLVFINTIGLQGIPDGQEVALIDGKYFYYPGRLSLDCYGAYCGQVKNGQIRKCNKYTSYGDVEVWKHKNLPAPLPSASDEEIENINQKILLHPQVHLKSRKFSSQTNFSYVLRAWATKDYAEFQARIYSFEVKRGSRFLMEELYDQGSVFEMNGAIVSELRGRFQWRQ